MSQADQDPFQSIVDSLRDDDEVQTGRLIYDSKEHEFPGSHLLGYQSNGSGRYWRNFPEQGVLHTCTPMAKNFKLPPHWAEEFHLIKFNDKNAN